MVIFKRVISAVSGGIDSAVSTLLLKNKGYEVIGVFMQNWDLINEKGICTTENDMADANWICQQIGIPFQVVNFVKKYWLEIFSNLIDEYEAGCTPNPDILCNKRIKFEAFFKYAIEELGADCISTGHYARTTFGSYLQNFDASKGNVEKRAYFLYLLNLARHKGVHLLQANDAMKDQTFFLSQISQNALQKTMFPIGCMKKTLVRQIVKDSNLKPLLKKKESMGICFIGSRNFQKFISEYVSANPGNFIDIETGKIVGRHKGVHQWTIGQRCRIGGYQKPLYIVEKDAKTQDIIVAPGNHHPALYTDLFLTSKPHWIHSVPISLQKEGFLNCDFRFQHTHPLLKCEICMTSSGKLLVRLAKALRAITAGQYAVFYQNEECLGSARILSPGPSHYTLGEIHYNSTINTYV